MLAISWLASSVIPIRYLVLPSECFVHTSNISLASSTEEKIGAAALILRSSSQRVTPKPFLRAAATTALLRILTLL